MGSNPNIRILPTCEEKLRLRDVCAAATRCCDTAVNEITLVRGKTTRDEYDRLRAVVHDRRNARSLARQALGQHKQEHGCWARRLLHDRV